MEPDYYIYAASKKQMLAWLNEHNILFAEWIDSTKDSIHPYIDG